MIYHYLGGLLKKLGRADIDPGASGGGGGPLATSTTLTTTTTRVTKG